MTKIFIFTLSVVLLMGCDRLKLEDTTKIQIQLPSAPLTSAKTDVSASTSNSSPEPTGFTGAYPVNCYMVAAAGPEEAMSKNKCFSRDNVNPSFANRPVGIFVGAVPASGVVSIDVPSGRDRSIYLVGFHAADMSYCRDFKAFGFPEGTLSHPYFLGEKTGLELKAGATVDISLNASFNANNVLDCTGPDFPESNGGGNPQVEANHLAADFYHSVGVSQCHPMRLHLYADVAGVQNYNVKNSSSRSIGLPSDSITPLALSFFNSEADCSSTTGSITMTSLPAGSTEKNLWFKATASAGGTPTPLPFTISGLAYTQVRTLFTGTPSSATKWYSQNSDSLHANDCRDYQVIAADSSGIASAAADSSMAVEIRDIASGTILSSPGISFVDNCVSKNPVSAAAIPIVGTKLRTTFGIKASTAVPNDFKLIFKSTSLVSAETLFNVTPVAKSLRLDIIKPGPFLYSGDCAKAQISLLDINGASIPATKAITANANLGSGAMLTYSPTCGGTPAAISFAVSETFKDYGMKVQGVQGTYNFDLFSPYVSTAIFGNYTVKETPVTTMNAKVHAVVESLEPNTSPSGWQSSAPSVAVTYPIGFSAPIPVSTIANNRMMGIPVGPSAYATASGMLSNATTVAMRYKWTAASSTGAVITTNNGTYTNTVGINTGIAPTQYTVMGVNTGIAVSNNWVNIAFTLEDSSGSCTLYVQEPGGTLQTYAATSPSLCNSYSNTNYSVSVGSGTDGNVKTISIFYNALSPAAIHMNADSIFNYMNQRYP